MTDALQNAYCSFNEKKKEFPIFRAIFSDKPTNVTSNPTVLVNRYEFCFELSRKENERLKNTIEASILAFVCGVIQPHLKIENVKFVEPLSPIINVLNDSASNPVDTVIGSRNWDNSGGEL